MEFIRSRIEFYCQKALIGVAVVLLFACGGQQNSADTVFPMHAIAGASQLAAVNISAPTFGPRANYTITKTSTGYTVTDAVGGTGTQTFSLTTTQIVFSDMTVNLGIGDKSQTISSANLQSLIELYIAYFNRVPDADGLSYWIDQLVAGQSIDQIGTSFYNAAIQYSSLTGYSSSMSNSDFITLIYKNVLGRTSVDSSGMNYWLQGLANGSQTRGTLVRTILGSAHTFKGDATYGYVADLLDNKVKFANSFTIQQGLNYNTPQDSITNTMAMVAAITPTSTAGAISKLGSVDWNFAEVKNPIFSIISVSDVAPVPTVQLLLSQPKVAVGSPVTLTWTSTNATSCMGSNSLPVVQPIIGAATFTPTVGGLFTYTLTCIGAGGHSSANVTAVVPMKVFATSYENKNEIALDTPKLPHLFDIAGVTMEMGEQDIGERQVAFADFMQEGAYSAITATGFYKNIFPGSNPLHWPDAPAKLYFLRKNSAGNWIDVTSQMIKSTSERFICVSPGFIEIADINNDGKPDAVISCTGPDFTINGVFDDKSIQYAVMSQSDGSYKVVTWGGVSIYAHQVSLADIDGDGNVDILSVDPARFFSPIVLWGNGDGTFRLDKTRFPVDMFQKAIYGIHAIPVNGKINVVVSGNPPGSQASGLSSSDYGTKVLQYSNNNFQYVADYSSTIPKVSSSGLVYGLALDVIYKNGSYYFLRVNGDYTGSAIVKTNAITGVSKLLTEVVRGNNSDTSGILKIDSKNNFISQMGACGPNSVNATDYFYYQCTFAVPLQ